MTFQLPHKCYILSTCVLALHSLLNPAASHLSSSSPPISLALAVATHKCSRVKMTRLRLRVAERLKGAQNTYAMLSTFNEVDMTGLMEMRAAYKVRTLPW